MDRSNFSRYAVSSLFLLVGCAALAAYGHLHPSQMASVPWIAVGAFIIIETALLALSVPAAAFSPGQAGLISLDRLPQIAALLVFGPFLAGCITGTSVLLWYLFLQSGPQRSAERISRVLGGTGMYILVTLAAGLSYAALGGTFPPAHTNLSDIGKLAVLILTLQVTNEVAFLLLWLPVLTVNGIRYGFDPKATITELAVAPFGVLTALIYDVLPAAGFALYVLLIVSMAFLFRRVVNTAQTHRRRANELAAINTVNQAASAAGSLDELLETIHQETSRLMHFAAFIIAVYDQDQNELDVRLNYDEGIRHPPHRQRSGQGLLGWIIENNEPIFITDLKRSTHPVKNQMVLLGKPPVSILAQPITYQGAIVGAMSVQDYVPNAFKAADLRVLENFASQIAVALQNIRLFSKLIEQQEELERRVANRTVALERTTQSLRKAVSEKEALLLSLRRDNRRDPLTRLGNRRLLDETLPREVYRATRFNHPLSLAMADIDRFKNVNDQLGHLLGDKVLKRIGALMTETVRATDLVIRYGGEEFVLIFPETALSDALTACEKLRTLVENYDWARLHPDLHVTVSIGLTGSSIGQSYQPNQLLSMADASLYQAKTCGRNRVCSLTQPAVTAAEQVENE